MTPMFPSASDYAEAVKVEVSLVSVKHSTIALGASATTHIGKLACASVSFFQILGFTDTETIRPSQSTSKYCQPFWNVLALGILLILMVSYSFPVVSMKAFEVRDGLVHGILLITVRVAVSLKINLALVWQL
jgi:hypothetical protein